MVRFLACEGAYSWLLPQCPGHHCSSTLFQRHMQERDATCAPLVATGDTLEFTESGQYSTAGTKKTVSVTLADGKALNYVEGLTF